MSEAYNGIKAVHFDIVFTIYKLQRFITIGCHITLFFAVKIQNVFKTNKISNKGLNVYSAIQGGH